MPPFDPTADFALLADGLQAVSLVRRGSSRTARVAHALRRSLSRREASAHDGQYALSDARWLLPKPECPVGPAPGDAIIDAGGNRWIVLSVTSQQLTGLWECACRDLAVAHGLGEVIALEQATYEKSPAGAAVPTWHSVQTGIRARIQPLASTVVAGPDDQRTRRRFRIVVGEELSIGHDHRIRAADATVYRILSSQAAAGAGELQTLEVEPWS